MTNAEKTKSLQTVIDYLTLETAGLRQRRREVGGHRGYRPPGRDR